MKSIDTNLVVRLLLDDDPRQSAAVAALLQGGAVFLSPTVLLETIWVLQSCYGASGPVLRETMALLVRHPHIVLGAAEQGAEFFRLWQGGLDAEDAAHLAFAGDVQAFVTFDRALVKRANKLSSLVVAERAG